MKYANTRSIASSNTHHPKNAHNAVDDIFYLRNPHWPRFFDVIQSLYAELKPHIHRTFFRSTHIVLHVRTFYKSRFHLFQAQHRDAFLLLPCYFTLYKYKICIIFYRRLIIADSQWFYTRNESRWMLRKLRREMLTEKHGSVCVCVLFILPTFNVQTDLHCIVWGKLKEVKIKTFCFVRNLFSELQTSHSTGIQKTNSNLCISMSFANTTKQEACCQYRTQRITQCGWIYTRNKIMRFIYLLLLFVFPSVSRRLSIVRVTLFLGYFGLDTKTINAIYILIIVDWCRTTDLTKHCTAHWNNYISFYGKFTFKIKKDLPRTDYFHTICIGVLILIVAKYALCEIRISSAKYNKSDLASDAVN